MCICLYVPCGHLLGKSWPLGSCLWCLTVSLLLSNWYPGSGVVLDCIDSWSLHPYLLLLRYYVVGFKTEKIFMCNYFEFGPAVQDMLEEALGKSIFNLDQWFQDKMVMRRSRIFCQGWVGGGGGGGGGMRLFFFFLVINIFHRGPYGLPSWSNWTQGVRIRFSKETFPTCDFPGGPRPTVPPSGSTHDGV